MDLKLLNRESVIEFGTSRIPLNLLTTESISAPAVSRLETIANKVVKFMLTEQGSNAFDTSYGSKWVGIGQVAKPFIPKYTLIINADITRCISYLRKGEENLPNSVDKLYTIKFNGLEFSDNNLTSSTEILLNITIYTTLGNKALFTLTR